MSISLELNNRILTVEVNGEKASIDLSACKGDRGVRGPQGSTGIGVLELTEDEEYLNKWLDFFDEKVDNPNKITSVTLANQNGNLNIWSALDTKVSSAAGNVVLEGNEVLLSATKISNDNAVAHKKYVDDAVANKQDKFATITTDTWEDSEYGMPVVGTYVDFSNGDETGETLYTAKIQNNMGNTELSTMLNLDIIGGSQLNLSAPKILASGLSITDNNSIVTKKYVDDAIAAAIAKLA